MAGGHKIGIEWVSISDLMSGVVGVMVVMFAVAAVQVSQSEGNVRKALREREKALKDRETKEEELKRSQERVEEAKVTRESAISGAFATIGREIVARGLTRIVEVDVSHHLMKLRDATFASGSACVEGSAKTALRVAAPTLRELLEKNPDFELFVRGHTDSVPLWDTTSTRDFQCARFDDNFTLSTARAREARNVLIDGWPQNLKVRIALAGYGDAHPIPGVDPTSPTQRRVEISVHARVPDDAASGATHF